MSRPRLSPLRPARWWSSPAPGPARPRPWPPGGVAGGQRVRRCGPGARPDLHPQGRRAIAAPVRSRPARLSGFMGRASRPPRVPPGEHLSRLRRGLLRVRTPLPVEPDARLLGETERWQLAGEVVAGYPAPLEIAKTPAAVTAMVLKLSDELAEHLIDTDQLRDTHVELERLVHTPAARTSPARRRAQPAAAGHARHPDRSRGADPTHRRPARPDAGGQGDGLRLPRCPRPRVWPCGARRSVRNSVPATGWCCSTNTRTPGMPSGSRCRPSSVAGVDGGLALTAVVTRSSPSTAGGCLGHQPAAVHHRFPVPGWHPGAHPELRTSWRNPPRR